MLDVLTSASDNFFKNGVARWEDEVHKYKLSSIDVARLLYLREMDFIPGQQCQNVTSRTCTSSSKALKHKCNPMGTQRGYPLSPQ
jgi:hypothetical protein